MLTEDGELTNIGAWYIGEEAQVQDREPSAAAHGAAIFAGWGLLVAAVGFWGMA